MIDCFADISDEDLIILYFDFLKSLDRSISGRVRGMKRLTIRSMLSMNAA